MFLWRHVLSVGLLLRLQYLGRVITCLDDVMFWSWDL